MIKFIKYLLITLLVLISVLYIAINSSYVFEKVAGYFAPKYNIRYDRIDGNAFSNIVISGLYYGDKKLARQIDIKLNPATLLHKQVTVSLLKLDNVNVDYIMYMVDKLSSPDDNSSSSPLPVSIMVKDIRISLLKFTQADILFDNSKLAVDYIYYDNDEFDLGELSLSSQTSLGSVELHGKFKDTKLHLTDATISSLDTKRIEELFLSDDTNNTQSTETPVEESSSEPSIFIPTIVNLDKASISILPREYQGVNVKLLTLQGVDIDVDLDKSELKGDVNLSIDTNLARLMAVAHLQPDIYNFKSIIVDRIDINATQELVNSQTESSDTNDTTEVSKTEQNSSEATPYLAKSITVDSIKLEAIPSNIYDIDLRKVLIGVTNLSLNTTNMKVNDSRISIKIDSDIANITQEGRYTDDKLYSKLLLRPKSAIISKYSLPIRDGAIDSISINSISSLDNTEATIKLKARKLLDANDSDFNLDVNSLVAKVAYDMNTSYLSSTIKGDITTPYTKKLLLDMEAFLLADGNLTYKGNIHTDELNGLDTQILDIVANPKIALNGTLDNANISFTTDQLKGTVVSSDLKSAKVHIETLKSIPINRYANLPKELNSSKVQIILDAPIDFNNTMPINAHAKIKSDLLNMDAQIIYDGNISIKSVNKIPKDSPLYEMDKSLNLAMLTPLKCDVSMKNQDVAMEISSKLVNITARYNMDSNASSAIVDLAGTELSIKAPNLNNITIKEKSKSLTSLISSVKKIYKVEIPPMSGDISLDAKISNLKSVNLTLKSNSFLWGEDKKSGTEVSNILLKSTIDKSQVTINNYRLKTSGVDVYSNKPSLIKMKDGDITISKLWVNDSIKVTGKYNLAKKKGSIKADASSAKIKHEIIDLLTGLNINTTINGEKISIDGAVHIDGGNLKYNMNKKSFANDGDIVILQRQKKQNKSFINNIKINVSVDSKKPIIYKKGAISVSISPDLKIKKRFGSDLKVYGKVLLKKGGYYKFKNKKFFIKKGIITFKGNASSPRLDIEIGYNHLGTRIGIKVTGTPAEPSLNFYSTPHMNREQILSYILFDTKSAAGQNQREELTNIAASALTKSLISSMGIKLDHLVLSGTGFEVGKKISDRVTIIYNKGVKSSMTLKVEMTKSVETDISFGAGSQSADIFYKKEY